MHSRRHHQLFVDRSVYGFTWKKNYNAPVDNTFFDWMGQSYLANFGFYFFFHCYLLFIFIRLVSLYCKSFIQVLMLYIGRFFVGFAGGAFFVVAPGYIGEIASKDIRGTLSSCLQLMVTAGILFVYVIGSVFTFHTFNYGM